MARKTINVEKVREWANSLLAAPDSFSTLETPEERRAQRLGAAALLEAVLQHSGNYKGWSYLPSEYLPADEQSADTVLKPGYDSTRRVYH